jgi:mannose-6-phosphate isomerase-like protein (cupin superfamily)
MGHDPSVSDDRPTFLNPHTGERITFLATAAETGGESTRMEIRVQPGPADWVGPVHFHPSQEEHFEVVAGEPEFLVAGATQRAVAGDEVTVPVRVPHIFRNAGADELVMVSEYRPGLRSVETFFATFFGLAQDGKIGRNGRPPLLASAQALWATRDYFVVTSPPPALQRVLFPGLSALARARGYRVRA